MPTTTKLVLPYPSPTDPADVPADMGSLATRIDTVAGAASGLATLDSGGLLPTAQLPPVSLSGSEVSYAQVTANVTGTAATEGAATVIIAGTAITYPAVPCLVDVQIPFLTHSAASTYVFVILYDAGSPIGRLGTVFVPVASAGLAFRGSWRSTFAGTHTFEVRAWANQAGTYTLFAGNGGASANYLPAYIRVARA